jgi:DHA2 family multidrug resistance protein
VLIILQVLAGLTSGPFYPLSLSYALTNLPPQHVIYGIGAYSMELIATLSVATPIAAWVVAHWSWRWLFWLGATLVPLMIVCVRRAMPVKPPQPRAARSVSWQGFFLASVGLSLLVGALEQGERLDWLNSGVIVSMLASGLVLLVGAVLRRWQAPNALVNLGFLAERSTLLLGGGLFALRFTLLSVLVVVPGYLGVVRQYRPDETGHVLLFLMLPQLLAGTAAARLMRRVDGRLVAGIGLAAVAAGCLLSSRLTSEWAGDSFLWPLVVTASGLGFLFVGLIGLIGQRAIESGAILRPVDVLTFASFFQVVRLFGGDVGVSALQHAVAVREHFHATILASTLEAGQPLVDERVKLVAGGLLPYGSSAEESAGRAMALLASQVGREAYCLSYADCFVLIAWLCACTLVALAFVRPTRIYFNAPAQSA